MATPLIILVLFAILHVMDVPCQLPTVSTVLLATTDKSDQMHAEVVPQDIMETTQQFSAQSVQLVVSHALLHLSALTASKWLESLTTFTIILVLKCVQQQPLVTQQDLLVRPAHLLAKLVQDQPLHA